MLVAKAKRKEKSQVMNNGCGVYLCVDFLFPFFAVIGGLQRLLQLSKLRMTTMKL
jgi:hypothetical protein